MFRNRLHFVDATHGVSRKAASLVNMRLHIVADFGTCSIELDREFTAQVDQLLRCGFPDVKAFVLRKGVAVVVESAEHGVQEERDGGDGKKARDHAVEIA